MAECVGQSWWYRGRAVWRRVADEHPLLEPAVLPPRDHDAALVSAHNSVLLSLLLRLLHVQQATESMRVCIQAGLGCAGHHTEPTGAACMQGRAHLLFWSLPARRWLLIRTNERVCAVAIRICYHRVCVPVQPLRQVPASAHEGAQLRVGVLLRKQRSCD